MLKALKTKVPTSFLFYLAKFYNGNMVVMLNTITESKLGNSPSKVDDFHW